MPFRPGDKLGNQYQIESILGRGGFGSAYLARDLNLGTPRVIKELLVEHLPDRAGQTRFVNEARIMASLNDPHIVTVYQLITPGDFPSVRDYFIVMEYMAGGSLEEWLDREGKLSVDKAIKIAIDVCRGLTQAHKQGIVHRNIKPRNILLSADGETAKVGGWDIAHLPDTGLTLSGQPGTLLYMSVEQAQANLLEEQTPSNITIDGRSDLYAVGATLFEMVTGRAYLNFMRIVEEAREAFLRQHQLLSLDEPNAKLQLQLQMAQQQAILQAIIERDPEQPTRYNPAVPPALETVILKALAKNPRDRFQTAAEMIEALQRVSKDPRVDELLEQARSASEKMKYPKALELLEQAKAIAPNDSRVYSQMALLYNLLRRHDNASRELEEGLKISPGDPALSRDLGLTYYKMGQGRKAIEALDRSLQLDPNQSRLRRLVKLLRQQLIDKLLEFCDRG